MGTRDSEALTAPGTGWSCAAGGRGIAAVSTGAAAQADDQAWKAAAAAASPVAASRRETCATRPQRA
ncbi:MAG: hypothetical protein U1F77_19005 [Kiritimatiellia bacterium]